MAAIVAVALTAGSTANINGNAFGDPKAKVTIEVFSDFQCPSCKAFHDGEFQKIFTEYIAPGKVYFVYRYFPLAGHPYGRVCAEYAAAAGRIGRYQKVWKALFDNQEAIARTGDVDTALKTALTPAELKQVKATLKSPEVQKAIDTDAAEGAQVPVTGTPTLWVTSRGKSQAVTWPINYAFFKSYIETLLNK